MYGLIVPIFSIAFLFGSITLKSSSAQGASSEDKFDYTQGSDCTEVRLDKPPAPTAAIKIQDQDGTLLCSAYTTSQLIDSWRVINDPPVKMFTSPVSLGVAYGATTNKLVLADFVTTELLAKARELKPCSAEIIRDKFNSKEPAEFLWELEAEFIKTKDQTLSSQKDVSAKKVLNCLLNSGIPNATNLIDLQKITNFFSETSFIKFQNKILNEICQSNTISLEKVPILSATTAWEFNKGHYFAMNKYNEKIKKQFNLPIKQPLGISYCRDVLTEKKSPGLFNSSSKIIDSSNCKTGPHTSTIYGRRQVESNRNGVKNLVCQYLVRDSYGTDCQPYPDDPNRVPAQRCEKGQVWVDEDNLLRNTSQIFNL